MVAELRCGIARSFLMKNNYGAVMLENSELHEHCVNC